MVSTGIGCTKSQGTTCMEELRNTVSGKQPGKARLYANSTLLRTFQEIWEYVFGKELVLGSGTLRG